MAVVRCILASGLTETADELVARVEAAGAGGLYLGPETCSRLLPTGEQISAAQQACADRGFDFVLVTPAMVPEPMVPRIRGLLELLADGTEVVVNDWGILRLVGRELPRLEPVLGRMLCGLRPDPRVPTIARRLLGADADELLIDLAEPPVLRPQTVELLRRLRVRRLELNPVAQGLPRGPVAGFTLSLHQPWSILATTRFCPQQRISDPGAPLQVRPCARQCLERAPVRLESEHFPTPMFLVGNALLARGAEPAELRPEIDRLVEGRLSA